MPPLPKPTHKNFPKSRVSTTWSTHLFVTVIAVACLGFGILIGYWYAAKVVPSKPVLSNPITSGASAEISSDAQKPAATSAAPITAVTAEETSAPPSSPPSRFLSVSPLSGVAPLTVQFKPSHWGLSSQWIEFGDGVRAEVTCLRMKPDTDACLELNVPTHTYTVPGAYTARYRAYRSGTNTGPIDMIAESIIVVEADKGQATLPIELRVQSSPLVVHYPGQQPVALDKEVHHLTVISGGVETPILTDRSVKLVTSQPSPSGRFLYLLTGQVAQDASVTMWIFDAQTRTIECVRLVGEGCAGYQGWARADLLNVDWLPDDRLRIEYDNSFLHAGVPESGPAIGKQEYLSSSPAAPWYIIEVSNSAAN